MSEAYYHNKKSVDQYIKLAKDVNGRELISKLKNHLSPESKLLEIGSGPGTDWRILNEDFNVIGSDNSKEFLKHLRSNNPSGIFLEIDAITINTKENFKGIYSNKVLQHLTNEELSDSIKRQYEVLTDGGIVCHSFWKGEGAEFYNGLFVNYQTEESLTKLFETYFYLLTMDSYAEFEDGDSILLIGKRK